MYTLIIVILMVWICREADVRAKEAAYQKQLDELKMQLKVLEKQVMGKHYVN